MNRLRECFKDDTAQVVLVTAICMVVVLGFLGLAIDVGHLRQVRRQTQALADAAAMAGGLEIRVCAATASCPAMQAAVKAAMVENQRTATFLMNCAAPGTGLTVTLNDPPCALGNKDPNNGNTKYVEAVVTQEVRTYFARLVGYDYVKITARAEAKRGVGPCIYALNPTAAGAITVPVALALNVNCAVIDESNNTGLLGALTCLAAFGSAPKINVTGTVGGLLCGTSPPVNTRVPVPTPADPMAYLALTPPDSGLTPCPTTTGTNTFTGNKYGVNITLPGSYTFNPGIYCGGISLTATAIANVTFNPGVYILRDGKGPLGLGTQGGLNITAPLLSSIKGTGVLFYNEGNVANPGASVGGLSITAPLPLQLSNISLSAATSGQYGGVLFWQQKGVTTSGTYIASVLLANKFEGAIYQPSAKVVYAVGVGSSSYNLLVADQLNFTGQVISTFKADYSALANGSPLQTDTAVLVQ